MGRPFGDFPVIFVLRCTNSCGLRLAVFFRVSTTKSHNGSCHDSTVKRHAIYPCQVLGDGVREILPYPCPAGTSNREIWERLFGRNANIQTFPRVSLRGNISVMIWSDSTGNWIRNIRFELEGHASSCPLLEELNGTTSGLYWTISRKLYFTIYPSPSFKPLRWRKDNQMTVKKVYVHAISSFSAILCSVSKRQRIQAVEW